MSDDSCANTLPLTEWIKKANSKVCRPCTLPILAVWYVSELEETGNQEQSNRIKQLAEDPDISPEQLATELDNIKAAVASPLKERLKEFDCSIQNNE